MNKIILLSLIFFLALSIQTYATDITTCSNLNISGTTYNLTADIANYSTTIYCMNLSASNIILDCLGHAIDGIDTSDSYGIYSGLTTLTTNITIRNCLITDWTNGIYLYNVANGSISNITSSSSVSGIQFYYVNTTSITNSVVKSNTIYSMYLKWMLSSNISNITTSSNGNGIHLIYSNSSIITNLSSSGDNYGMYFLSSTSNNITNVFISGNNYGIMFNDANSHILKNSIIQNNVNYGIYLTTTSNNSLIYNNLFNNTYNFIFQANNTNNSWNTTSQAGTRIYSNGNQIGGNYWTNSTSNGYSDTCTDTDENGFCDSAYTLNVSNIDYLPLSDEYVISTCTNFLTTGEIDCADNCVNTTVTVPKDLHIFSTGSGTVNLTDITIQGGLYENYTHSCTVY